MSRTFDPDAFIRRIGERLVDEFKDAKAGTTPSTVGSAAEQPVRDQLEQVLPRGLGVGEGFVIDNYDGTSRQQDVVVYERDICPVFSVNRTAQTTYYPCEGVIAVGEIKSRLDGDSLEDAFRKVASAKELRRYDVTDLMPHPTTGEPIPLKRNYLSPHRDSVVPTGRGTGTERAGTDIRVRAGGRVAAESRNAGGDVQRALGGPGCERGAEPARDAGRACRKVGTSGQGGAEGGAQVRRRNLRGDGAQGRPGGVAGLVVRRDGGRTQADPDRPTRFGCWCAGSGRARS